MKSDQNLNQGTNRKEAKDIGSYIIIGLILGAIIGIITNDLMKGVLIGLPIGILVCAYDSMVQKKND